MDSDDIYIKIIKLLQNIYLRLYISSLFTINVSAIYLFIFIYLY